MNGFRETARAVRRGAASAVVLAALLAISGCSWFGADEK